MSDNFNDIVKGVDIPGARDAIKDFDQDHTMLHFFTHKAHHTFKQVDALHARGAFDPSNATHAALDKAGHEYLAMADVLHEKHPNIVAEDYLTCNYCKKPLHNRIDIG